MIKDILQSLRLKDHVHTIGIDQSLRNNALYEHKFLQNIKSYTNNLVSVTTSKKSEILLRMVSSSFFTSIFLVNRHSDFWALGFLVGVDGMGGMGLLLVNPSGVETIAASRISLNCCWSSHLPACLYNLLMFSRHLCSYIALLLKDRWIPMVYAWYFSRGDCKIPLRTTHFCSNVSIERT